MNDFQYQFEKLIEKLPPSLIVKRVKEKLEAQGVHLTDRQEAILLQETTIDHVPKIRLHWWQFWNKSDLKLELDGRDAEEIEKSLQYVLDHMQEIINDIVDTAAPSMLRDIVTHSRRGLSQEQKMLNGFRKRLNRTWSVPLTHLSIRARITSQYRG